MPWIIAGVGAALLLALWLLVRARKDPLPDDMLPFERERNARQAKAKAQALAEPAPAPPPRLEDLIDGSLRPLARQLASDMPFRAAEAARTLGETGHPDAARLLVRALRIENRSVRFAVVEGLFALGEHAPGLLREALAEEKDADHRQFLETIRAETERRAAGSAPTPMEDLLAPSQEQIDKLARDLAH